MNGVGDDKRSKLRRRLFLRGRWSVLAQTIWVRAEEIAVMAPHHPILSDEHEPSGDVWSDPQSYGLR